MDQSWLADPRFENYWSNYQKGKIWYLTHQTAHWRAKALAIEYENAQLHWLLENVCKCQAKLCNLPHAPGTTVNKDLEVREQPTESNENGDENLEMEISDELMDFFALSMKHKIERKVIDDNADVEYVNEEELPGDTPSKFADIKEKPDPENPSDQYQDYQLLYGANAPRIQAMETAMQLTFHRNCDRKQPKFWPSMPLRP